MRAEMGNSIDVEADLRRAIGRAEHWKNEVRKLKMQLAERPGKPPKIAKSLWYKHEFYLILGDYSEWFGKSIVARKIKDDGTLGSICSGVAVCEEWGEVKDFIPDSEAIEIARRHKDRRQWAAQFLRAHGVE
jgi:hypothetical protein